MAVDPSVARVSRWERGSDSPHPEDLPPLGAVAGLERSPALGFVTLALNNAYGDWGIVRV